MNRKRIGAGSSFESKKLAAPLLAAVVVLIAALPGVPAWAQGSGKRAEVWTRAAIQKQFDGVANTAKAKGSAGAILGSYENHALQLSTRTASGQVEVHNHFVDIIYVVKGQATLLTGGSVVGAKAQADGEVRGTSMRGGVRQSVSAGDLIHIPAGVPHQFLLQPGTTFEAEIVKVRVGK